MIPTERTSIMETRSDQALLSPRRQPIAKVVSEILLSQLTGVLISTGANTLIGLLPISLPSIVANFVNGIAGYLNGRLIPGTLGTYLISPTISREELLDMVTRVAGLGATITTSALLLAESDFFDIDNPASDAVAENTTRMLIGSAVGTAVEFGVKRLFSWATPPRTSLFYAPSSNVSINTETIAPDTTASSGAEATIGVTGLV